MRALLPTPVERVAEAVFPSPRTSVQERGVAVAGMEGVIGVMMAT